MRLARKDTAQGGVTKDGPTRRTMLTWGLKRVAEGLSKNKSMPN